MYKCPFCKKIYNNPQDSYNCFKSHDVVYVPFRRSDLLALVSFLYTGNQKDLPQSLVDTILSYSHYNKSDKD